MKDKSSVNHQGHRSKRVANDANVSPSKQPRLVLERVPGGVPKPMTLKNASVELIEGDNIVIKINSDSEEEYDRAEVEFVTTTQIHSRDAWLNLSGLLKTPKLSPNGTPQKKPPPPPPKKKILASRRGKGATKHSTYNMQTPQSSTSSRRCIAHSTRNRQAKRNQRKRGRYGEKEHEQSLRYGYQDGNFILPHGITVTKVKSSLFTKEHAPTSDGHFILPHGITVTKVKSSSLLTKDHAPTSEPKKPSGVWPVFESSMRDPQSSLPRKSASGSGVKSSGSSRDNDGISTKATPTIFIESSIRDPQSSSPRARKSASGSGVKSSGSGVKSSGSGVKISGSGVKSSGSRRNHGAPMAKNTSSKSSSQPDPVQFSKQKAKGKKYLTDKDLIWDSFLEGFRISGPIPQTRVAPKRIYTVGHVERNPQNIREEGPSKFSSASDVEAGPSHARQPTTGHNSHIVTINQPEENGDLHFDPLTEATCSTPPPEDIHKKVSRMEAEIFRIIEAIEKINRVNAAANENGATAEEIAEFLVKSIHLNFNFK